MNIKKQSKKEYDKKRYLENKEDILEKNKSWQKRNPERANKNAKKWYKNNSQGERARGKPTKQVFNASQLTSNKRSMGNPDGSPNVKQGEE